ncbi:hypothetical protein [Streptococcus moroccensis]|uniref:Uncharacterized protein n=1 Tax=Streptococcus moroccensis TaxID=1451356 RepID=A0ABT9YQR2_9STRE|nr:hypothetical protein [Streptococcus moroccensis]MDQ0222339.1 hypothetical protein [Streptococcus moroccensis]
MEWIGLEINIYLCNQFVKLVLGNVLITNLRKTDIRSFYIFLAEERKVKVNTIDSIHTVLHQVLEITVEDCPALPH